MSILAWWLTAEGLGLVAVPLCFVLFRGLPDRGFGFTKIAGLLLLGYITWLAEILQFTDFTRITLLVFLVLLAAGGAWLAHREWPDIRVFVSTKLGLIVFYELLFLAAFLFLAWFRGFNPAIAGTEKPMDFALIDGILRSSRFPPNDPWMSGFSISYYYFGYYLAAMMIRLSGVMPAVGFNLSLASTFGLAAVGAAALLYNLTGRRRAGLLAVFLLLLSSNLDGFLRVLRYRTLAPQTFWWWWNSSRVLHSGCGGQCIDEFPQFSFMLGDLHPHVMALPLDLLALGLALAMLKRPAPLRWSRADLLALVALPIAGGALGFANTWDLPAYLGLILAAVVARQFLAGRVDWRVPGALLALAFAAYLPFYIGFQSQAGGVGLVQGQTTPDEFLRMWAFPFAFALALLLAVVRLPRREALIIAGLGVVLMEFYRHWLVALMLPLAAAALWRIWLRLRDARWDPDEAFALGLVAAAFGLIALCEVVFLKDNFNNRMNTIFKFYYEVWLLLAVAGAYGITQITQRLRRRSLQSLWLGSVGLICAASFAYPVASFYTKADELKPAWTLDGSAFMKATAAGDLAAIDWLNSHVKGEVVIAEATGPEYSQFARFGTFTGLESILGWAGHELQWRGVWREQPKRIADLTTLYTSANSAQVQSLLSKYHVSYVVVGPLERQAYGNRDYSVFGRVGHVVLSDAGTTLYQVNGSAGAGSSVPAVSSAGRG